MKLSLVNVKVTSYGLDFEVRRGTKKLGLGSLMRVKFAGVLEDEVGGCGKWLDSDADVAEVEALARQLMTK